MERTRYICACSERLAFDLHTTLLKRFDHTMRSDRDCLDMNQVVHLIRFTAHRLIVLAS